MHLCVTKRITNQQIFINSLKSKRKESNDYFNVTKFKTSVLF